MKCGTYILLGALVAAIGCEGQAPEPGTSMVAQVHRSTWDSPAGPGEVMTSSHYRVFTTTRNPMLQQYLPGFMEAAYDHYLTLTRLSRSSHVGKMDLYVLATREQWASLTQHRLGPQSELYLQLEAGGYMLDGVCVLWDIGVGATLSVASHEGLHQFLHHRLKQRIPMWVEEGLCATAEGMVLDGSAVRFTPAENPSRFNSLRDILVRGYWIDLPDLLPMDAGDAIGQHRGKATGYYAQVWSLILFLRSRPDYESGLQKMLNDAASGALLDEVGLSPASFGVMRGRRYNRAVSIPAFRHYISDDLDGFEREWREFATHLAALD